MARRRPIVVGLLLGVVGCSSPGTLVLRHAPATPVDVKRVETAGTYGLFIAGEGEPLLQYPLKAGDPLGFDTSSSHGGYGLDVDWLNAVAGNDRHRLDFRQTYEWRRLPDEK